MSGGLNMQYNSARERLAIPEYGRNVQKLIKHAKAIESDELRQAFVSKIVDLMMQMHPQNKNLDDYREKLWKHVFRIADFELPGVVPPTGEVPTPEDSKKRPHKVAYPSGETRFKHYGGNVQTLIKKALEMEEGPKKDGFVKVIASYMKLAYRTWNKEHYVSDDIIKGDLDTLSSGKLSVSDNTSLDNLSNANRRRKRSSDRDRNDRDRHYSNGRQRHRGGRDHGRKRK